MKVAIEIIVRSVTKKIAVIVGIAEHNWLKEEECLKKEVFDLARDLKIRRVTHPVPRRREFKDRVADLMDRRFLIARISYSLRSLI